MDKKWEIRRISTPERIFNKIKEEMTQPIGIILFGADCKFKDEIYGTITETLWEFALFHDHIPECESNIAKYQKDLTKDFRSHRAIVMMMTGNSSSKHSIRHAIVSSMRDAGAKTIIGIYAKTKKWSPKVLVRVPGAIKKNEQIAAIEQSNPTADGLDYFIVVEEE